MNRSVPVKANQGQELEGGGVLHQPEMASECLSGPTHYILPTTFVSNARTSEVTDLMYFPAVVFFFYCELKGGNTSLISRNGMGTQ